jgi:DNA repair protein SbcC/Rad50
MNTTALRLGKIDLTGFRGIERRLGLDFGRRLTIIYGGNATGKSSVAQGVEFALSGQVRDVEGGLLPARYLANARAATTGRVSLTLDDGAVLSSATDELRPEIERRFREIGEVDWPDRQPLPLTTTHVTTQGMLARILGSANVVTRNDLSGLCAGAYLRSLVSRSSKLADHFRQASSGRNIQSELADARATYSTAKLLYDSLLTTGQMTPQVTAAAVKIKLRDLNARLNLPEPTSIDVALSRLEGQLQNMESQLQTLQRLLSRSRELGQYEAELNELRSQLELAQKVRADLLEKKTAAGALLQKTAEALRDAVDWRANLLDQMASYERHQQSVSAIAAFQARLRDVQVNAQQIKDDIQRLRQEVEMARNDLAKRSTRLAQARQSRQVSDMQRSALQRAMAALSQLPDERDPELEAGNDSLSKELAELNGSAELIVSELRDAKQEEAVISARLVDISKSGERFLAAASEMRSYVKDSRCPLCGHDHGSIEALEQSIRLVSASAVKGAELLQREFESISQRRQTLESRQQQMQIRIAEGRAKSSRITATIEKRAQDRANIILGIEDSLRRAGVSVPLDPPSLRQIQAEVEAKIASLDEEIRDETSGEREEESRRSQSERTLAARVSEAEQSERLVVEMNEQIARLRAGLGAGMSPEQIAKNKAGLAEVEQRVQTLELEHGEAQAKLSESERAIVEKASEIAGIESRLQAVQGFLDAFDVELKTVGASRNVHSILETEQRVRDGRDEFAALRNRAQEIKQDARVLEQSRTLSTAQEALTTAEQSMISVQKRQQRLQERAVQFKKLHQRLETSQNDTAELVLSSIRRPVQTLFQAMTAGCPWEIEFRLENGKVSPVLADGATHDVAATSVLNSAYVNVAAIALRLALASQQRWTRLRTVILDDPILEMDLLTQSALIDGLEAVLVSNFAPWSDLQFVLTTWSEDFAVMAAHKLAHLNYGEGEHTTVSGTPIDNEFVIHRLSLQQDGAIAAQRHVPRWQAEASAA